MKQQKTQRELRELVYDSAYEHFRQNIIEVQSRKEQDLKFLCNVGCVLC